VVDIFDEVEEELREERMREFVKKYGILLIAACLLVVGSSPAGRPGAGTRKGRTSRRDPLSRRPPR
jgi:hypothetical protein